jgi:1,4-dihydroxy-2-naphthoate octaprenyltransferase
VSAAPRPAAPAPASAPSSSRPSAASIWWHAARPNTLPAALAGVIVGLGAGCGVGAPFRPDTALGCVAVALLLQVLANFANDLSDFRKGADTAARQGPMRVAAAGLVTERQLEAAIAITIAAAGVVGLWLAYVGGPVLIGLGVLAVVAALAYTGGPWPYGYRGLGEVFVFLFFGVVAVVGTAYLQAGRLEPVFFAASVPVGALTTAILVVNNLRDIPTDREAGKRTIAVMVGERGTQREWFALVAAAFATPVALAVAGWSWLVLVLLLAIPFAAPLWRTVRGFTERRQLNAVLKGTARLSLLVAVLFALGLAAGPR